MNDSRCFDFIHYCMEVLKESQHSSETWISFAELLLILFLSICQADTTLSVL